MSSRTGPANLRKPVPFWLAALVTTLIVVGVGWVRLASPWRFSVPIGYGVPLVLIALFRSRALLWGMAAAFVAMTLVRFIFVVPETPLSSAPPAAAERAVDAGLIIVDLLMVCGVTQLLLAIHQRIQNQNENLEASNNELIDREEEIARTNEELQSQAEELERQTEELRVANEELASREKVLQILLDLSRSLKAEFSRGETMSRICQTLGDLVSGPDAAAAILEQEGGQLIVKCHHGFGPVGLAADSLPMEKSLAALVLSRGRTGFIEDIGLRPDLQIPQPREGRPFASVLAAPLRVGGMHIGTLECYSRQKTTWTAQQIALVESMAAQTSVSLEAAELFEMVAQERERFETVLRTVPVAIAVSNADCTDIRLNAVGALLFGSQVDMNVAELMNRWALYRNGRAVPPNKLPLFRVCWENGEVSSEEYEFISPGGRRVVLLCNARPIREANGSLAGGVAAFVDITPQKELQRELDLRRREAEEASVRKTRFLAAVSHDIRTPANAIGLLAELVRRTAANPAAAGEVPALATELQASATSLVNLLSDVLDLARFDSGKVEIQESEFLLASMLEEEHRQMLPLAREKGISFVWKAPPNPVRLRTDRIKLSRILGNLIGNAIKFTDEGEVRVEAEYPDHAGLIIRVADTGIGMAPDSLAHIFDEFFQLRNPERDRSKGIGLGLTICRRLVDAMGGKLDVTSTLGQGSTFTVTLPEETVLHT